MMSTVADAESLKFLVNPAYQCRVNAGKTSKAAPDRRMRYRKRILALHQTMMKGEAPECGLKAAHDAFVGAAIRYIRMEERRELVQGELDCVERPRAAEAEIDEPYDMTAHTVKTLSRPQAPPTMDNFVVRTRVSSPMPVPRRRRRRPKKSHGIVDAAQEVDKKKVKKKKKNVRPTEGRHDQAGEEGPRSFGEP